MIEALDYGILKLFQQIHTDVLTAFFRFFTNVGEGGMIWIIVGVAMLLSVKTRKYGIIVLSALLMCLIFGNGILKHVVARPRPCWRHPEVEMLIGVPTDFSFPSGHTFSSFAAALSIAYWNRKYGYAAFAIAVIITLSRLYFFVHYPTDVLGGAIFGSLLAVVSIKMVEKLYMRQRRN